MFKIIINKDQLNFLVKNILKEKTLKENFRVEPLIPKTPRERQLGNVFGSYNADFPDDVIRYMRKSPQKIFNRLNDLYGDDKFIEYATKAINRRKKEKFGLEPSDKNKTLRIINGLGDNSFIKKIVTNHFSDMEIYNLNHNFLDSLYNLDFNITEKEFNNIPAEVISKLKKIILDYNDHLLVSQIDLDFDILEKLQNLTSDYYQK